MAETVAGDGDGKMGHLGRFFRMHDSAK